MTIWEEKGTGLRDEGGGMQMDIEGGHLS